MTFIKLIVRGKQDYLGMTSCGLGRREEGGEGGDRDELGSRMETAGYNNQFNRGLTI